MRFHYDLHGHSEIIRDYPVFGNGSNINRGAVVIKGATAGTDQPFAILGTGALADVLGVMEEEHVNTVAGDDSNTGGTNYTRKKLIINPLAVFEIEYDQTDIVTVTSTSSTTVTITSLENNIDGGYLYAPAGTGLGRLTFLTASASGSATSKETTGWASDTDVIKILPLMHQILKITATGDLIGTDAAAGSGRATIIDSYIEADSIARTTLNPVTHSGLTGLNDVNVKFLADIVFDNHFLAKID